MDIYAQEEVKLLQLFARKALFKKLNKLLTLLKLQQKHQQLLEAHLILLDL